MPTIASFFGIIVYMYWRDHAPPHVHAMYQGFEALVAIEIGEIIGGMLPKGAAALMRGWVLTNRAALEENWRRGQALLPFERIPGADSE